MKNKTIIIIPARWGSTRLPGKPMHIIGNKPMILWVYERAIKSGIRTIVATDDEDIFYTVENAGGECILIRDDVPSGTDRVFLAYKKIDKNENYEYIINLQGDMPLIDPSMILDVLEPVNLLDCDIATLASPVTNRNIVERDQIVKLIPKFIDNEEKIAYALYFTRSIAPWGEGIFWHHCGIYCYKTHSLKKFCGLPPSKLELREKLEQLRAIENGMKIGVKIIENVPYGVDTLEDLIWIRNKIKEM